MKNSGKSIPCKYDFSLFVAQRKSVEIEIARLGFEHEIDFSELFVNTDTSLHNFHFPQKNTGLVR